LLVVKNGVTLGSSDTSAKCKSYWEVIRRVWLISALGMVNCVTWQAGRDDDEAHTHTRTYIFARTYTHTHTHTHTDTHTHIRAHAVGMANCAAPTAPQWV